MPLPDATSSEKHTAKNIPEQAKGSSRNERLMPRHSPRARERFFYCAPASIFIDMSSCVETNWTRIFYFFLCYLCFVVFPGTKVSLLW